MLSSVTYERSQESFGHAVLPQDSLVARKIHQWKCHLRASDISMADNSPHSFKKVTPWINFRSPVNATDPSDCIILTFANISAVSVAYGQTGLVTSDEQLLQSWLWNSYKQAKICFSSVGEEILAVADAEKRSLNLRNCLTLIFEMLFSFPIRLSVHSYGLL